MPTKPTLPKLDNKATAARLRRLANQLDPPKPAKNAAKKAAPKKPAAKKAPAKKKPA